MENLIKALAELGLGEYEARSWCALVAAPSPRTAYEVAKAAAVPTSKVYEALARLRERGLVDLWDHQGKSRYTGRDPEEFLETAKRKADSSIAEARRGLNELRTTATPASIRHIADRASLLERAGAIIAEAREWVLVSLFAPEAQDLEAVLQNAEARGVALALVHFGETGLHTGMVYPHPIADTLYEERGGRGFTLVSDRGEALVATVTMTTCHGAVSDSPAFATLAEDYIKHDIYITKIVKRLDPELQRRFGPHYQHLRNVFADEEEQA